MVDRIIKLQPRPFDHSGVSRFLRRVWVPLVMVAAACAPTAGAGPAPTTPPATTAAPTTAAPTTTIAQGSPVITSFAATTPTGPNPLTSAFRWMISDPNSDPLTCALDLDANGTFETTVLSCSSASSRAATFSSVGSATVSLRVSDGISVPTVATTSVTVGVAAADQFSVTVRANGSMSPGQSAAFTTAAARWAQVIRTGLSDVSLTFGVNDCGTGAPAFSGTIDDVMIDATIAPIDGVGGTLGSAGPCYVRSGNGLPIYGVMRFDSADVAALEASGQFTDVVLHEMGHVLGFGTVWASPFLSGAGTSDPRINGAASTAVWQTLGGSGGVPVEDGGGPGTADAHWRETTFDRELMTGYLDSGSNPLSALTIASLADLGYGVTLGAADPYGLPGLRSASGPPDSPGLRIAVDRVRPPQAV